MLKPSSLITKKDRRVGLRHIVYDGVFSQIMGVLTGGAFLTAYALLLGASPLMIGLIAALGPLSQLLQIPAIFIVEKFRYRRLIVVIFATISRLFWFVAAIVPWFVARQYQADVLVISLFLYFGFGTVSGLAWNSWMKDLIPEKIFGRYLGRRLAIATAVGAVITLAAGFFVDGFKSSISEQAIYSGFFIFAGVTGLIGVVFLAMTPEPEMLVNRSESIWHTLTDPVRNLNFRQLLYFSGLWSFSINIATPFFTVYMLQRLKLNMSLIVILAVVSQIFNVLFYSVWGRLADRLSNKSVLLDSGILFILTFVMWPFTTMPESYVMTVPLLVLIHILAGISTAGVTLCTNNIALELAPRGKAVPFLAVNACIVGIASTLGPLLGGLLATFFEGKELKLLLTYKSTDMASSYELPTFIMSGLDFIFVIAAVLGLYSIHRLLSVREEGEVEKGVVFSHFQLEIRKAVTHISNVAGIRELVYFPFYKLRDLFANDKDEKTDQKTDDIPGSRD